MTMAKRGAKKKKGTKNANEKRRRKIEAKIFTIHSRKLLEAIWYDCRRLFFSFILILERIKNCTFKLQVAAQNHFL